MPTADFFDTEQVDETNPNKNGSSGCGCLVIAVVLIVVLALFSQCGKNSDKDSNETITMPNVVDLSTKEAKTALEEIGFDGTINYVNEEGETLYSVKDVCPILGQEPAAGTEIEPNATITLTSLPEIKYYMQQVASTSYEEAEANILEIYNAWNENEIAAKETYYGNRYVIGATITNISDSGNLAHITTNPVLTLEVVDEHDWYNNHLIIYAEFEKKYRDELMELSTGQQIVLSGVCNNWANYYDCIIAE